MVTNRDLHASNTETVIIEILVFSREQSEAGVIVIYMVLLENGIVILESFLVILMP